MRIWSFQGCEYDERQRQLWIRGKPSRLGPPVIAVLAKLLQSPEHACTSLRLAELWVPVASIDSVKDAVRQVRAAMAKGGVTEEVIRTIRGKGFQIAGPVAVRDYDPSDLWEDMVRNAPAPLLPGWFLREPLEPGTRCRVWRIERQHGNEVRVVKYAAGERPRDMARRAALRREARAWQALERGLPNTKSFVRIYSSHLTTSPCYLESEFGGPNLAAWFKARRSEGGPSRETCLQIMADLAEAIGAAHGLGIIHNDLKPANILIAPAPGNDGRWQVKVADFGVASVIVGNRLGEFQLGDRTLLPGSSGPGGTSLYRAPEIVPGMAPTTEADVYALGVVLFQLLSGDFQKTPGPGWEQEIADPILHADIADACNLDPVRRPKAPELAERLRSVELRRAEAARAENQRIEQAQKVAAAEELTRKTQQRLATELAKRPFRRALVATLVLLGIVVTVASALEIRSLRKARDRALEDRRQANKLQDFTTNIIFGGGPNQAISAQEFAQRGMKAARFLESEPELHASVLNTLGGVFQMLGNFPNAERVLQQALDERRRIDGPESPQAAETMMQQAALLENENKTKAALELAQRAISIQEHTLPADDIAIYQSRTKLAEIWTDLGQYDQATTLLERSVAREKNHPELLSDLSTAYNDLGIIANYQGQIPRSLDLLQASMQIDRKLKGDRHPDIANELISIANAHEMLGQYDQDVNECREALSIFKENLPEGHHEIAAAQAHLGNALASLSPPRLNEAREYLNEAIQTLRKEPERSGTEAYAEIQMAYVDRKEEKLDDALTHSHRALTIYKQMYPTPVSFWLVPLNEMDAIYSDQNRWSELRPLAEEAYQVANQTVPPNDPRRLVACTLKARSLAHEGQKREAEELLRQVLQQAPEGDLRLKQFREDAQRELNKLNAVGSSDGAH